MKTSKCTQLVLTIVLVICMNKAATAGDGNGKDIKEVLESNGISHRTAISLSQAMDKAGFSIAQQSKIAGMLADQNNDSILAVSFQQKIDEGVSKKVGPGIIVRALEKVRIRYKAADRFVSGLRKENKSKLKEMVIDCLAAGLTQEDAFKIQASLRERERSLNKNGGSHDLATETMLTAREMVRQGVRSRQTASLLEHALTKGEDVGTLQTLRNRFKNTLGGEASDLANQYQYAFEKGMTISQANRHEFRNPEQTSGAGLGNSQSHGADKDRNNNNGSTGGGGNGSESGGNSGEGGGNGGASGGGNGNGGSH